jgi:hypothetical protein
MKKIILGTALLFTVGSTFANTLATANSLNISMKGPLRPSHNAASVAAFNAMYPGAVLIKWQAKGEGVFWVNFIYNGVKMSAKYNYLGVYLGA